jgi:hypothetical protein
MCPEYGLKLHDRLHPGGALDYMGAYEKLDTFPATLLFYRCQGSHLNGVCPLINYPGVENGIMGLSMECIEIDVLHTIDLGVTQRIIGFVLMLILNSGLDLFKTGPSN